jgi:2-dehydro-3-deoxy-D-arabinonate dehydratase
MKIYNTSKGILVQSDKSFYLVNEDWNDFFNNDNLYDRVQDIVKQNTPIDNAEDIIAKNYGLVALLTTTVN